MIRLSLIVPVYNQAERLANTLTSLQYQIAGDYTVEVILVDDGSTDGSPNVAGQVTLPFARKLVRLDRNYGRSVARNKGVEAAEGDIVIFLDGDMIVAPDYLARHAVLHQAGQAWSVTGAFNLWRVYSHYYPQDQKLQGDLERLVAQRPMLRPAYERIATMGQSQPIPLFDREEIVDQSFQRWSYQHTYASHVYSVIHEFGAELTGFPMGWSTVFTGDLSIPRAVLKETGLFDEEFISWGYEDQELGFRLHLAGVRHHLAKEIIAYHQMHPVSLEERAKSGRRNFARLCEKYRDLRIWTLGFAIDEPQFDLRTQGRMLLDYQHLCRCGEFMDAIEAFRQVLALQAECVISGDAHPYPEAPALFSWQVPVKNPDGLKARAPWLFKALEYGWKSGLWRPTEAPRKVPAWLAALEA